MNKLLYTKLNLVLAFCFLIFTNILLAQAPPFMNYQAVARDNSGAVLQNQAISVRLSIHTVTPNGTIIYQETHLDTTNQFGLFSVLIGNGTVTQGVFSSINWAGGGKYLQVEFDANAPVALFTYLVVVCCI